MAPSDHTYGPTCHLARAVAFSGIKGNNDAPPLRTQFFYSSPLPIDDPLTPVPPPSGDVRTAKHPPRPFSTYDNNSLEEAWLGLSSQKCKASHRKLSPSPIRAETGLEEQQVQAVIKEIAARHLSRHDREHVKEITTCSAARKNNSGKPKPGEKSFLKRKPTPCCDDLEKDIKQEQHKKLAGTSFKKGNKEEYEVLLCEVLAEMERRKKKNAEKETLHCGHDTYSKTLENARTDGPSENEYHTQNANPFCCTDNEHSGSGANSPYKNGKGKEYFSDSDHSRPATGAAPNEDTGVTGLPFERAPSRTGSPKPLHTINEDRPESPAFGEDDCCDDVNQDGNERVHIQRCKAKKMSKHAAEIPVGISRLHLVELPALQMKPIYWSPVHDIAAVTRGTWFYRGTMYPVEPAVANQLEFGYRELRPWSQTWNDELTSALNIGAEGEEKIMHKLWPFYESRGRPYNHHHHHHQTPPSDQYCAARCFDGEMAAEGTVDLSKGLEKKTPHTTDVVRRYPNSYVIYRDSHNAYILKPNLCPSAYYGRKPLSKISKGTTVGIHVVRGFDWSLWSKLHPDHKSASSGHKTDNHVSASGTAASSRRAVCHACSARQEQPKVTDLVLVIHGIGQKLSERVESFHFTHAINSFRRQVNVELANENVQSVLRPSLGGIMVLPVNWRHNLSFEDGGPEKEGKKKVCDFNLKDITPDTMPSVRNLVSDVMLDIPYYMSHHKPKMIEALIYEANRVYGLWCQNNPHFHAEGRVHIIAHSLGSVMALDVLSKQPTKVQHSPHFDPTCGKATHHKKDEGHHVGKKIQTKHFDFDTRNLFFCGSPAGFFLLLEKSNLLPRRGKGKRGSERDCDDEKLTGEAGQFGCLAVDNLYNVMHYNDAVTYRLNGCVDACYAASLKNARVPSSQQGWLESLTTSLTSILPGSSSPPELGVGQVHRPAVAKLPSQLEMEVHDFSREEVAEKKFYLLNDNGQIDYFLSSGGGPLEIQYLNMLSAHSSYWTSTDFIRMLVVEVGRRAGKKHTLPNMRAVKRNAKIQK